VVAPRSVAASGSSACSNAGDRKPSTLPPVGGPSTRAFFRAAWDAHPASTFENVLVSRWTSAAPGCNKRTGPCKRATALPSEPARAWSASRMPYRLPPIPARARCSHERATARVGPYPVAGRAAAAAAAGGRDLHEAAQRLLDHLEVLLQAAVRACARQARAHRCYTRRSQSACQGPASDYKLCRSNANCIREILTRERPARCASAPQARCSRRASGPHAAQQTRPKLHIEKCCCALQPM